MTKKTILIIQARMGSKRLPGKVMMKIKGKPLLGYVLERVLKLDSIFRIVVATTILPEDDLIESYVKKFNVDVFRGNPEDVLDRFYKCSKKFNAENIIRISADSPFIDPHIIEKCVQKFQTTKNIDYLSNTINNNTGVWKENYNGFPIGLAVEIFNFSSLEKAWRESFLPSDREHVTEYIWRHPQKFSLYGIQNRENKSNFRLVVDYKEDFNFIKRVIESMPDLISITLDQLIEFLNNNPSITSFQRVGKIE